MKETSKAMARRAQEKDFPWLEVFRGPQILDVGSGDDPLSKAETLKNGNTEITDFDLPDGGGDDLTKFFAPASFDCVHGSQVLEHALDPAGMLRSWLEVVRPGGYIVATVPEWGLYEGKQWPSRWNAGHRSTWEIGIGANAQRRTPNAQRPNEEGDGRNHIILPEWLGQFPVEVLLCRVVDTNFDYGLSPEVDQTFDFEKGVEAFIEFVLRRV